MASLIVISWRDIPAQVIVKRGRETAKVQLSQRFQEAVDRAAMRAGKGSSDAYLADWQRSAPRPCGEDLQAEASAEAAKLEAQFSDEDLERLIRAKGLVQPAPRSPPRRRGVPDVRRSPLVRAPCARLERVLSRLRGRAQSHARPVQGARLRAHRASGRGDRAHRQGRPVRLPHVRTVRAELDRHVVPDELSEDPAQRTLRRRARQRHIARSSPTCAASGSRPIAAASAFPTASRR